MFYLLSFCYALRWCELRELLRSESGDRRRHTWATTVLWRHRARAARDANKALRWQTTSDRTRSWKLGGPASVCGSGSWPLTLCAWRGCDYPSSGLWGSTSCIRHSLARFWRWFRSGTCWRAARSCSGPWQCKTRTWTKINYQIHNKVTHSNI